MHAIREGTRLQFWRFSFIPAYNRDRIFAAITSTFTRFNIVSYIAYETLGSFDLLLRLWVPRQYDPEDLALAFEAALRPHSLWANDFMVISSVERHWAWTQTVPHATPAQPQDDSLQLLTNDKINELHEFNTTSLDAQVNGYPGPQPPTWAAHFETLDLLRPLSLERNGVRLFVTFDHPARAYRRQDKEDALARIDAKCRELLQAIATDTPTQGGTTPELTLYSGHGTMSDFLIIARAPSASFHEFLHGLIFGLRDINLDSLYNVRPYTHVIADRTYTRFVERPLANELPIDADLIDREESAALEFKSTYLGDLRRYFVTGERAKAEVLRAATLKAICGMLNSPIGGVVVIGVLQVARELERSRGSRASVLEKIRSDFPLLPPVAQPDAYDSETKAIVGLEFDYLLDGAAYKDFDSFIREIERSLKSVIHPNPLPYISPSKLTVGGRTVAAFSVRPSLSYWFYADLEGARRFYVRELASTREYTGLDAEGYRGNVPRSPTRPLVN